MIDLMGVQIIAANQIYVVGDIHGCFDLLLEIEARIFDDIRRTGPARPVIVYVGDYIDKGPLSYAVLDYLSERSVGDDWQRIFLRGNHEDRLLKFLENPYEHGPRWVNFGGKAFLENYGIMDEHNFAGSDWNAVRDLLRLRLPSAHQQFLKQTQFAVRWGGFLLVHAGVNPALPFSAQNEADLMWIREPFLTSKDQWAFRVIHGHVPVEKVEFRTNRIAIDTGACETGILTCLVLETATMRLIQTGRAGPVFL